MTNKLFFFYAVIFVSAFLSVRVGFGYDVCGSSSIILDSPVTEKQQEMVRLSASDSMTTSLYFWMQRENFDLPDLSDSIENHFFLKFRNSCIEKTKAESMFEGHEWSLTYCLPSEQVMDIFSNHNARFDSMAIHYWKQSKKYEDKKDYYNSLKCLINSIYYSTGHMGSKFNMPGDTVLFKNIVLEKTQKFINSISITTEPPFVKGKPSYRMTNEVLVTALIDSFPLSGLPLKCEADGKKIFSLATNDDGKVLITQLKIPFVPNGSFLHIMIDLSDIISVPIDITLDELGLKGSDETDQTLIFTISQPEYTLDYTINSANKIKVPESFSKSENLEKYLKENLHMVKVPDTETKDISISIQSQVSSYNYDKREMIELKIDTKFEIIKLGSPKKSITEIRTINKNQYDSNAALPLGEFFWQAHNNLINTIKELLDNL